MSFSSQSANHVIREIDSREYQKQLDTERLNEEYRKSCRDKLEKVKTLDVLFETFGCYLTQPLCAYYEYEKRNRRENYESCSLKSFDDLISDFLKDVIRCQDEILKKREEEYYSFLMLLLLIRMLDSKK